MNILSPGLIYRSAVVGIALVLLKVAVGRAVSARNAFATIRGCPGRIILWIDPRGAFATVLCALFPSIIIPGYIGAKLSVYKKFGTTSFVTFDLWTARAYFWLADPEAAKLVSSDRSTFRKDAVKYEIINISGQNIFSTEGSDWKRHRSISMSAFNEANIALVWSETFRVINEWFEQLDAVGSDVDVDLLQSMTQATLLIIVTAGFGKRMSWSADSTPELPPGCKLTFQSAVVAAINNIISRAVIPPWFYQLSSFVKVPYLSSRALLTQLAYEDLRTHILQLVVSARADIASGVHPGESGSGVALLRNLVEANMDQDGESKRLTEGELISNIFGFLVAGHETSAHTLCFAFVFLALYPGCQEKVYEEVARVWSLDVPVSHITMNHKEYMDKLEYTMACVRETLRMFPSVPCLPKDVHADTVLPGTHFTPELKGAFVETGKFSIVIPAGSTVNIDVWALHMNPLYWGEDAGTFKPERFIDTKSYQWPRNAFLPFAIGARSCLGQRFAYAEIISILASVVRRYRILVPDDLAKKPFEERKEMLLKWTLGITLTPANARVKLCRRT